MPGPRCQTCFRPGVSAFRAVQRDGPSKWLCVDCAFDGLAGRRPGLVEAVKRLFRRAAWGIFQDRGN